MIRSVGWNDAALDELMALLSSNAAYRLPAPPMLLPGDVAWRLPGADPESNIRLICRGDVLEAFVWFDPDTGFEFDWRATAEDPEALLRPIFDWACERRASLPPAYPRFVDITDMDAWRREIENPDRGTDRQGHYLTTIALESDDFRIRALEREGFTACGHHAPVYFQDLTGLFREPEVPGAARLRSVTAADIQARIDVHRAAWVGSSFDAERYGQIRSSKAYDENLDIVLERDGTFGSYAICWADPTSGIGHFEPVGTHPDWRGTGAGRAVILEGLRRLRQAGMRRARVSTAGFNHPAQALYESCGFERVDTERTFIRQLT